MITEIRSRRRAHTVKAVCLLVMHWNVLASPLSAGEIPVVSAAAAGLSDAKLAEVDKFMEHQVADKKIAGGIVIVSHNGRIGFSHAYGQMDLDAHRPTRADTIFRIYSMSKAITTAAALNLVDAGKIGVDDPVSKYIPSFADL
jgi:CubicO group peptidase (beta-lactamase class C family)